MSKPSKYILIILLISISCSSGKEPTGAEILEIVWIIFIWFCILSIIDLTIIVLGYGAFKTLLISVRSVLKWRKSNRMRRTKNVDELKYGRMLFNPPKFMKVGIEERIEVRLSQSMNPPIQEYLKGSGKVQIEAIKIGEYMTVRLSGVEFRILELNRSDQYMIPTNDYAQWAWEVTPLKSGTYLLHLHVTVRIILDTRQENVELPVYDAEIKVLVNPIYSTLFLIRTHWKIILSSILIPVVAWIVKSFIP